MNTKPYQHDGCTYYFDPQTGERVCTGAMMGRRDAIPTDADSVRKLHLRRMRLTDGGCYDQGGAYWGHGDPLFCAWGESKTEQVHVFCRAKSREEAKARVRAAFRNAEFFR